MQGTIRSTLLMICLLVAGFGCKVTAPAEPAVDAEAGASAAHGRTSGKTPAPPPWEQPLTKAIASFQTEFLATCPGGDRGSDQYGEPHRERSDHVLRLERLRVVRAVAACGLSVDAPTHSVPRTATRWFLVHDDTLLPGDHPLAEHAVEGRDKGEDWVHVFASKQPLPGPPQKCAEVRVRWNESERSFELVAHTTFPPHKDRCLYEENLPAPRGVPVGDLTINSRPWSHVRIDGESAGVSPVQRELAAGEYRIRMRTKDGREHEQIVRVVKDERVRVFYDFDE